MIMIGQTFGKLTILHESQKRASENKCYWTICSCGNLYVANGKSLKSERTKSCGCLKKESSKRNAGLMGKANTKHGMARKKVYHIWQEMRRRCKNPKLKCYKHYGGRGIKVCEGWNDFIVFKDWAYAAGYQDGLTIDRIDNDGNYTPGNCQWLTREDNTRKGSKSIFD